MRPVEVGSIKLRVPTTWMQQPPANRLRLAQFEIPPEDGDQEPAELSIFNFGAGGSVAQQVNRWINQFEPGGRKVMTTSGESPHGKYVYVDLSGTYRKPVGPPVARRTEPMPGARMLVVMIAVKDQGNYFLKLVGSQKTVGAAAAAFRESFGAAADEQPLEINSGD